MQYTEILDVTINTGSSNVTVASGESLANYTVGDYVFVDGHRPVFVASIVGSTITLSANATFTLTNGIAVIAASNVKLREALVTISSNNASWAQHFHPFLNWISTSEPTAVMYDVNNNPVTVSSAQGLSVLAEGVESALGNADVLVGNMATLETDVANLDADIMAKLASADAAQLGAETAQAATNLIKSETQVIRILVDAAQLGAETAQTASETAKDASVEARTGAESAQSEVDASKLLAQQYANHPEDVLIPGTSEYSALHYKQKTVALSAGTAPDSVLLGGEGKAYFGTAAEASANALAISANALAIAANSELTTKAYKLAIIGL